MMTAVSSAQKMERFYSAFPYPNRPWFVLPNLDASIMAHAGFAQLLSTNNHLGLCEAVWRERRRSGQNSQHSVLKSHVAFNLVKSLVPDQQLHIASVGCGTDEPTLLRCLHPKAQLDAFDVSTKSLRRAKFKVFVAEKMLMVKRTVALLDLGETNFIAGDATATLKSMPDDFYNHIQCFGVLHHQDKPTELLAQMARSLAPGGTLRLMTYTHGGRRLERGLQKRYSELWDVESNRNTNTSPSRFALKCRLHLAATKLYFWRLFLALIPGTNVSQRFRYLGFSRALVADALLHPSDPGLPLAELLPIFRDLRLDVSFVEAKFDHDGWKASFGTGPKTEALLEEIARADMVGTLSSNLTLLLRKNP